MLACWANRPDFNKFSGWCKWLDIYIGLVKNHSSFILKSKQKIKILTHSPTNIAVSPEPLELVLTASCPHFSHLYPTGETIAKHKRETPLIKLLQSVTHSNIIPGLSNLWVTLTALYRASYSHTHTHTSINTFTTSPEDTAACQGLTRDQTANLITVTTYPMKGPLAP